MPKGFGDDDVSVSNVLRFHLKLWESKLVSSFESDGQRWANEVLNHRIFGVFQGFHYVFTRSSGTSGNFFGTPGPRVGCP